MKTELIRALAKQLRLPTLSRVEEAIREAEEKHWPYDEFLSYLLSQEVAQRQENQLQRKTQAARFPLSKGLDTSSSNVYPMSKKRLSGNWPPEIS